MRERSNGTDEEKNNLIFSVHDDLMSAMTGGLSHQVFERSIGRSVYINQAG
jgi:hypothetical protein